MKNEQLEKNQIVKHTFEFALDIIEYREVLEDKRKFVLANQLLKSGTSIGANVWEAQNSESRNDFIHKFKIATKESEETSFWLLLCKHSESYPDTCNLVDQLTTISKIINRIVAPQKSIINKRINQYISGSANCNIN